MKHDTFVYAATFLFLVGSEFAQNSAQCQSIIITPDTLTFNVTGSPSVAQTVTLTNNTGSVNRVNIAPSAHTQLHIDGFGWMSSGWYSNNLGNGQSWTVYVRVLTDVPVDILNEQLSVWLYDYSPHPFETVKIQGSAPLPIQLSSFKATTLASNGVMLSWTTASEMKNYGFNVQRNGVEIAFIQGHGTTSGQHTYSYTDNPGPGKYQYRLQQIDLNGTATLSESVLMDIAGKFTLGQNYPNPFNPSTQIAFVISKEGAVSLRIYDILGREVATLVNENRKAGQYTERFDGSRLSSGVYMYVLQSGDGRLTNRMILSK